MFQNRDTKGIWGRHGINNSRLDPIHVGEEGRRGYINILFDLLTNFNYGW